MLVLVRMLVVVVMAAAMTGCAAPQTRALLDNGIPEAVPRRSVLEGVPFIPQKDFYCGPAALTMTLQAAGVSVTQEDVARAVYTPGREGTLRSDVLAGARRWGRIAFRVTTLSDLLKELAAGNPVLVFQNLSLDILPQWHFAVAVGYDLDRREVILHSGTLPYHRTRLSTFERTWERGDFWGLVVTSPTRLPETASEIETLQAISALEKQGLPNEAAVAYGAAVRRWPDSFAGHMGLGNALLADGRAVEAERAYRKAIDLRPLSAEAWNNLAYALVRSGRRNEAVSAAENAVRYGSGRRSFYLNTLNEIRMGDAG